LERIQSIDFLKFVSIFIVICLHSFMLIGNVPGGSLEQLLVEYFPRYVIPFFFMTAGFFFVQKVKDQRSANAYTKRYLGKLGMLFLIWYFLYFLYDCLLKILYAFYSGTDIKKEFIPYIKKEFSLKVFYYGTGVTSFHLWFLTALFWSILVLYIFLRMRKHFLLLVCSLILNLIGLFGQTYSGFYYLPVDTRDAAFFGLFYTSLGGYIAVHCKTILIRIKTINPFVFAGVFLVCSGLQVVERVITLEWGKGTKGGIDYYLSTIPLTIVLFIFLLKHKELWTNALLTKISKNTEGIYVAHVMMISVLLLIIHFFNMEFLLKFFISKVVLSIMVFASANYFSKWVHGSLYKIVQLIKVFSKIKREKTKGLSPKDKII
jgi:surface polysaccharide O-acyltransferase-like enzyme